MNDFTFHNPTKVYFGKNQLSHLHEEIRKYGNTVLLVYGGGSIKRTGLYDKVIAELKENNIEVYELSGVEPNPRHTTVNAGAKLCKEHDIRTVLSVGGGSVIDCGKAIAATTLSDTDNFWDLVDKNASWNNALPVIAMPTIASTGSEMDKSCVIANEELKVKQGINGEQLRPVSAFLNPENTFSVPARQTASGGFDIIAHLFDMNYFVNSEKYPLQFNVVEAVIKTVVEQLPVAVREPENEAARSGLLWAASWALNSFCTSGFKTVPTLHMLEQFSSTYDMTHGMALAVLAPKWMQYVLEKDESTADDFARFGYNVMKIEKTENTLKDAEEAVKAFQKFIVDDLKLPATFRETGLENADVELLLEKALHGSDELKYGYRTLSREDCRNIYHMCL